MDANGKVTAKKAGTATITATTKNGLKATCKITVTDPATKVYLTPAMSIKKGSSVKLTASVFPKTATDKLTWSTSNKKVVTVTKSGKIKGVKTGTATITVKTTSGKKATCKVTVKVPATKVKLNKTKATVAKGRTLTLKATMTPSSSTDKLTWTSSNKKVATVDKNGKVKALKKGAATITVKTASGKKATCKITVK